MYRTFLLRQKISPRKTTIKAKYRLNGNVKETLYQCINRKDIRIFQGQMGRLTYATDRFLAPASLIYRRVEEFNTQPRAFRYAHPAIVID